MNGILCAGNLVVDFLARPVENIRYDATIWVDDLVQSVGGNGANTAYAIARFGVRIRLAGTVGNDDYGDFILRTLALAGVELELIGRAKLPTPATIALVRTDGARALIHRPGASAEAFSEPLQFTAAVTAGCRHFHLANIFGLPHMRENGANTLGRAREAGLTTSMDTGWDSRGQWLDVVAPCLRFLDLLFANDEEARMLSGCDTSESAAAFFLERGTGTVVIKQGARGCVVFRSTEKYFVPGFVVDTVDTTGAGDCFAGAFLAARQQGASFEAAAELANAAAAMSVRKLGSNQGVPTREETEEWMRKAPRYT